MKTKKKIISALVFLAVFLSVPASHAINCGRIVALKGDIQLKSKGHAWKRGRLASKVCSGDTIKSGKNSRAKIKMIDGNALSILEKTELKIEKYESKKEKKSVSLALLYGALRSKVARKYRGKKNKFRVSTKAAVVGVRGTEFLTKTDGAKEFEVVSFSGLVAVRPFDQGKLGREILVRPGQSLRFSPTNKNRKPKKVPAEKLRKLESGSLVGRKGEPGAQSQINAKPGGQKGVKQDNQSGSRRSFENRPGDSSTAGRKDGRRPPPPGSGAPGGVPTGPIPTSPPPTTPKLPPPPPLPPN